MGEIRTKRVSVFSAERLDGSWPPDNLRQFIKWLQDRLAEVPWQHHGSAEIEISSGGGWDGYQPTLGISYSRLEASAETAERLDNDRIRAEVCEAEERAHFERLKQKYG